MAVGTAMWEGIKLGVTTAFTAIQEFWSLWGSSIME